jgi:Fe-S-cluster containining protein
VPTLRGPDEGPPVPDRSRPDDRGRDAGPFSSWLSDLQGAWRAGRDAEVPCGTCTACCTSSQFVQIGPGERQTLDRIPAELLFAAPRLPAGHVLLGYDQHGHCPMLIDNTCSIYDDRPRACRTYDCRVFAAADIEITERDKAQIAERVRQWQFAYPGRSDRLAHEAVRAAAAFLQSHDELLPGGTDGTPPTQLALLALELHDLFVNTDGETRVVTIEPGDLEALKARVRASDPPIPP